MSSAPARRGQQMKSMKPKATSKTKRARAQRGLIPITGAGNADVVGKSTKFMAHPPWEDGLKSLFNTAENVLKKLPPKLGKNIKTGRDVQLYLEKISIAANENARAAASAAKAAAAAAAAAAGAAAAAAAAIKAATNLAVEEWLLPPEEPNEQAQPKVEEIDAAPSQWQPNKARSSKITDKLGFLGSGVTEEELEARKAEKKKAKKKDAIPTQDILPPIALANMAEDNERFDAVTAAKAHAAKVEQAKKRRQTGAYNPRKGLPPHKKFGPRANKKRVPRNQAALQKRAEEKSAADDRAARLKAIDVDVPVALLDGGNDEAGPAEEAEDPPTAAAADIAEEAEPTEELKAAAKKSPVKKSPTKLVSKPKATPKAKVTLRKTGPPKVSPVKKPPGKKVTPSKKATPATKGPPAKMATPEKVSVQKMVKEGAPEAAVAEALAEPAAARVAAEPPAAELPAAALDAAAAKGVPAAAKAPVSAAPAAEAAAAELAAAAVEPPPPELDSAAAEAAPVAAEAPAVDGATEGAAEEGEEEEEEMLDIVAEEKEPTSA